jgi:hypothetical protein
MPATSPTHRLVENGDLLAFDMELVGPFGYLSDISSTYLRGDRSATREQRAVYQAATSSFTRAFPSSWLDAVLRSWGRCSGVAFRSVTVISGIPTSLTAAVPRTSIPRRGPNKLYPRLG